MAKGRYRDGSRSSIGREHVYQAVNRIEACMQKDIVHCTEALTRDQCVGIFFRDEDIAKIKELEPLLYNTTTWCQYSLPLSLGSPGSEISFHFDHAAPARERLTFQPERAEEFLRTLKIIGEKRQQYALVKYVVKWLDQNATPGAIRALWPSILQVCKDAPVFKDLQQAPVRYMSPPNAGPMLQLFRDTAATVALMGMMPDNVSARGTNSAAFLMLGATSFTHEGVKIPMEGTRVGLI